VPAGPTPPGQGVEGRVGDDVWRLGNAVWCGTPAPPDAASSQVWLSRNGETMGVFEFEDSLRADAGEAVRGLTALGLPVRLLSGDAPGPVAAIARAAGIAEFRSRLLPQDKVTDVARGRTLMVGDGINDAPAMRGAHVSMAPATASDIGRSAADFVYTGSRLAAVPFVVDTARRATAIATQNLVIAIAYNAFAVPLAIAGQVTPLIAAVAMSSSSIIVVANALRLRFAGQPAGQAASRARLSQGKVASA